MALAPSRRDAIMSGTPWPLRLRVQGGARCGAHDPVGNQPALTLEAHYCGLRQWPETAVNWADALARRA
jgi:hypothetical protein